MAQIRDYYEILGVSREATQDEIKRAYRKLAGANHPDRNPGDTAAVDRFKEAASAYEVLGDEQQRAAYDGYGHEAYTASGRGAAGGRGGFQDVSDVFSAFGDIFGDIFGNGSGGRGGARAQRGSHLRCAVQIDLREAATGCQRDLEITRDELCGTCDGSGARPGSRPEACSYCGGRGQVVQSQGFFRMQTVCPACRGAGEVIREKCPSCHGSGREAKPVRLEIKIPAGVDNGMQLCLRGEGEPGQQGGPRGDLYCDIHVAVHPLFERHEKDLHCRIPVTFAQAVLGAEFDIPLLEGKHKLAVPAGTQPGETLRIRGQGMPDTRSQRKGDLLVEIQVEVPRKLSAEQETLIRSLAELEKKHVRQRQKSLFEKLKEYFSASPETDDQD